VRIQHRDMGPGTGCAAAHRGVIPCGGRSAGTGCHAGDFARNSHPIDYGSPGASMPLLLPYPWRLLPATLSSLMVEDRAASCSRWLC